MGDYGQEYQKLLAAAKGGGLPDLSVAYDNVIADLMKANVVVPLDQYVNDPKVGLSKDSLDDIFPVFLDDGKFGQFNNQLLAFPFTKSLLMAYYDLDLLNAAGIDKPPETWDDFGTALKKLDDYAKARNMPWNGAWAYNPDASHVDFEIMSRGGKLISSDSSTVAFNNDQALQAMAFDAGAFKSGAAYLYKNLDWQNDFVAQKNAAHFDSSTGYAFIQPLVNQAPKPFKFVAAAPPNAPGQKVTVMYGPNVAIFKSNPQKQAASWEFIKWFTEADQTAQWSIETHYLPVRKSAAASAGFKKELAANQALKASFDLLPYAKAEPAPAGWQQVRDILLNMATSVATDKAQPKAALDDAEKKANAALAEAK